METELPRKAFYLQYNDSTSIEFVTIWEVEYLGNFKSTSWRKGTLGKIKKAKLLWSYSEFLKNKTDSPSYSVVYVPITLIAFTQEELTKLFERVKSNDKQQLTNHITVSEDNIKYHEEKSLAIKKHLQETRNKLATLDCLLCPNIDLNP
jgi:hypothetical protein